MNTRIEELDRLWYPDCGDHWDDELFRRAIMPFVGGGSSILDLGAGAGIVKQMNFRGIAGQVTGIDVDERVLQNPNLDAALVRSAESLPFPDASFDVVIADNVLEHLSDPLSVFREVARVLRPGGRFLAKTPSKWHYMSLIARITPHWFHRYYNRRRGRAEADTFPTLYRANSRSRIRALARDAGLVVEGIAMHEGRPEYLRINRFAYYFGQMYEKLVNCSEMLSGFRIVMIIELAESRKQT